MRISIETLEIKLEESFSNGRIDIAIKSLNLHVYIENKISADLGDFQLERYSNHVKNRSTETKLILLTRYYIDDESIKYVDKHVFWSELYSLIELFINSKLDYRKVEDDKKIYLLKQFLDFLKDENMSNEKVSWEYSEGVKSFLNLLNMIQSVLDQLKKEKIIKNYGKINLGIEWAGIYINQQDLWVGVYYDEPNELWFDIQDTFITQHGDNKFEKLKRASDGTPSYVYKFNETHFLAFSKEEQKKAIYKFVKDCITDLNKLI
ncbi:MAG: PD-(D/E)XK nuclease family protein [Candidatus Methanoperedens sp.]|nr:PD-(D/E)XK nuclease family protein [Candidatus Methanoperedens sp.]